MKLLLFILGVSLCYYGLSTPGGYQSVDIAEAQSNEEIQDLIEFGLQRIIEDGVEKGHFSSSNFVLTKINSVYRQVVNGENYKFNCQFDSDEDLTVVAAFEIYNKGSTKTVTSYSYEIIKTINADTTTSVKEGMMFLEEETIFSGLDDLDDLWKTEGNHHSDQVETHLEELFPSEEEGLTSEESEETDQEVSTHEEEQIEEDPTDISVEEVQQEGTFVNTIFKFGFGAIIEDGIKGSQIPNSVFIVSIVTTAFKETRNEGDVYSFSSEADNQNGSTIQMNFTVYYHLISQNTTLLSYSYEVKTVENNTQPIPNEPIPIDTTPTNITTSNETNSTNSTTGNSYTELTLSEIEGNNEIQSVLSYGMHQIIQKGYEKNKIPRSEYSITKVVSVSRRIQTSKVNYKCSVEIEDAKGVFITAQFTVSIRKSTQEKNLSSWSYHISENKPTNPTTDETYIELSLPEIEGSPEIQSIMSYGTDQVIQKGYGDNKLPHSEYKITKIVSVSKKREATKTYYKCSVDLEDDNEVLIETQFTVSVKPSTQEKSLSTWSYNVSNIRPPTDDAAYTNLSPSEVETSAEVQSVISYGINQVIQKGYEDNKIPQSQYNISKIVSVSRSAQTAGRVYYRCSVELEDVNKVLITAKFNITLKVSTQEKSISNWSYQVNNIKYIDLSRSEIENSAEIQSVLSYGTNQVIQKAYKDNKIPQSEYNISKIVSVSRKREATKTYYKCNVELEDNNDVLITTHVTVSIKLSTQEKDLSTWSYNVSNIRPPNDDAAYINLSPSEVETSAEVQSVLGYGIDKVIQKGYEDNKIPQSQYNISKIVSVSRSAQTGSRVYYRCNVELEDVNKVLITAKFNITLKAYSREKSISDWSYQVSNIKYIDLSFSEIESSAEVQSVLSYGADQVIQNGYKENKIPHSEYKITKVVSVSRKSEASRTYYKCNVELEGTNRVLITTQFTVLVKISTQEKTLSSWSYNVSNIKPPTDESYIKLSLFEIKNNTEIQSVLSYGIDQIIQKGYEENKVPRSEYSTSRIVSVSRSTQTGKAYYKCSVELEDVNKVLITAQFTVSMRVSTQEKTLLNWSYNVSNINYIDLLPSEIESSVEVQGALSYGTNQVIQKGYEKEKIPRSEYKITKIISVSRKIEATKTYYKCNVELEDVNKVLIKTQFTVSIQTSTQEKALSGFSYNVSNIKKSDGKK